MFFKLNYFTYNYMSLVHLSFLNSGSRNLTRQEFCVFPFFPSFPLLPFPSFPLFPVPSSFSFLPVTFPLFTPLAFIPLPSDFLLFPFSSNHLPISPVFHNSMGQLASLARLLSFIFSSLFPSPLRRRFGVPLFSLSFPPWFGHV